MVIKLSLLNYAHLDNGIHMNMRRVCNDNTAIIDD